MNPKDVQGWNGFVVVRSTEKSLELDYDIDSMQIEADLMDDTLDLMEIAS